MAIKLIANYSKRLGLPGYSSHQFSVSVESELSATDDIAGESTRLYEMLQSNVDEQMLRTGFVPPPDYGMEDTATGPARSDSPAVRPHARVNGNGNSNGAWRCSDKQRDLILKLVGEQDLDKNEVDQLSRQRFGKGVKHLSKLEASGLIAELLETHGGGRHPAGGPGRRNGSAYRRNPKGAVA